MKKILYLIMATICLTSCWVEKHDKIDKTYYANGKYKTLEQSLKYATLMISSAEKVDLWLGATSEYEKNLVETIYFKYSKIHQDGNIITVSKMPDYNNSYVDRIFDTGGRRLYDNGASWILATLNYSDNKKRNNIFDLKCIGEEQLQLISGADEPTNGFGYLTNIYDLIFTKSAFEDQYIIKGRGEVRNKIMNFSLVNYAITSEMIAGRLYNQGELHQNSVLILKGEAEFSWNKEGDKAQARITKNKEREITYKGFTESWPMSRE